MLNILLGIALMIGIFGVFGLISYLLFDAADEFLSGNGLEYLFFGTIFLAIDVFIVWAGLSVYYHMIAPYFLGR